MAHDPYPCHPDRTRSRFDPWRLCLFASNEPLPGPAAEEGPTTEPTLENKLAVVDAGGFVRPDDPAVRAYGEVLDGLERLCENTRKHRADMSVHTASELRAAGYEVTALQTLRHASQLRHAAASRYGDAEDCANMFARILTLGKSGQLDLG